MNLSIFDAYAADAAAEHEFLILGEGNWSDAWRKEGVQFINSADSPKIAMDYNLKLKTSEWRSVNCRF